MYASLNVEERKFKKGGGEEELMLLFFGFVVVTARSKTHKKQRNFNLRLSSERCHSYSESRCTFANEMLECLYVAAQMRKPANCHV